MNGSSGISGNMTLAALTEIIGDENYLIEELKKLNVNGYKIDISKKVKNGITGTYVDVILEHQHEHKPRPPSSSRTQKIYTMYVKSLIIVILMKKVKI